MLATASFDPLSSPIEQSSFVSPDAGHLDDVYFGDNGFCASSDNSSDSPTTFSWFCPELVKQEPVLECSPVKMEQFSDSDGIDEDEYRQASMKDVFVPTFPQQSQHVLPPTTFPSPPVQPQEQQKQQELPQLQQPQPQLQFVKTDVPQQTFFQTQPLACSQGFDNLVLPQGTDLDASVKVEKKVKLESAAARRKGYRQAKLAESIAGSPPLPPDLELPAILGGKLPPRTFKTSSKRKHVFTERELRSRRKRGLPDDSDSESEERRLVRLPRRSLLTITTSQMSHFVTYMRTTMQLTPSQHDELSRQKRLVKNRECACRFRAKKELTMIEYRERVNELENDVESLRAENERLRQALKEASVPKEFLLQQTPAAQ